MLQHEPNVELKKYEIKDLGLVANCKRINTQKTTHLFGLLEYNGIVQILLPKSLPTKFVNKYTCCFLTLWASIPVNRDFLS